jgi:hypothetical protein
MLTNWQTTLSGIPALFTACFSVYQALKNGQAPAKEEWEIIGASVSAFLIGLNAKDKNVTGGTVPQTPEAVHRVVDLQNAPLPTPRPRA